MLTVPELGFLHLLSVNDLCDTPDIDRAALTALMLPVPAGVQAILFEHLRKHGVELSEISGEG